MRGDGAPPGIPADWYAVSFGALYPLVYAHRDEASARREARFAAEGVALQPSDAILDLACGNGRHLAALAPMTRCAVGLDFSADLLRIARVALNGDTALVRADMRAIPFVNAFDVVFNFFTSFGYFTTREEDLLVARGLAAALKKDGRFFIDYLNPEHVAANLQPESTREIDGFHIIETRWIDAEQRRVNKKTVVKSPAGPDATYGESVRLYSSDEIQAILRESGLEVAAVCGNYDGASLDAGQPRMILTGRKVRSHA